MALPNDKISTTLVGNTLASGSRDVGTLCTHENINKWSKWKPIRSNKVVGINQADLMGSNFGLNILYLPDLASLINFYRSNPAYEIEYQSPTGGSGSPYRLGDFRNYNHPSGIPFSFSVPDIILLGENVLISGTFPTSDYSVDFRTMLKSFYWKFGAVVVREDQTSPAYSQIGGTYITEVPPIIKALSINIPNIQDGANYNIGMFLAEIDPTTEAVVSYTPLDGGFYTLLATTGVEMMVVSTQFQMPSSIHYSVRATNLRDVPVNLGNCMVSARIVGNSPYDPPVFGESTVNDNLGNITLSAYETREFSGTLNGSPNAVIPNILRCIFIGDANENYVAYRNVSSN